MILINIFNYDIKANRGIAKGRNYIDMKNKRKKEKKHKRKTMKETCKLTQTRMNPSMRFRARE